MMRSVISGSVCVHAYMYMCMCVCSCCILLILKTYNAHYFKECARFGPVWVRHSKYPLLLLFNAILGHKYDQTHSTGSYLANETKNICNKKVVFIIQRHFESQI